KLLIMWNTSPGYNWPTWAPSVHVFRTRKFQWLGTYYSFQRTTIVAAPLWMPLLGLSVATGCLWWRDRGPRAGFCPGCGYDLTGLDGRVCPECGAARP